ncbi:MAG: N-acetyl-gamma-glutamyl-phosphate reductase [Candidatus Saelkia tenebricola]|nr:N-acetyl-gamma-glutamyl-phosphate reductase [Candidatus Saelkia tenebricola]
MLNIGILGALGYTGCEIISYLTKHPKVKIVKLWDKEMINKKISSIFPEFKNILDIKIQEFNIKDLKNIDVVFLSLPHTVSLKLAPEIVGKVKLVIDLSADYRFQDAGIYEKWYGIKHEDKKNLKGAVYGLPEIMRDKIKGAQFIANPGCYPTSMILGLYPLAKEGLLKNANVIVDAKTGASGAGRKKSNDLLAKDINENIKPYKVNKHQHMPEVVHFLQNEFNVKFNLNFIPQLISLKRGIMSMIYVIFKNKPAKNLYPIYKKYYGKEQFVRLYNKGFYPELKGILNSNFCDLGYLDFLDTNTFLIISCIDNLGKGAASQAVQNMNVALGLKESMSLL